MPLRSTKWIVGWGLALAVTWGIACGRPTSVETTKFKGVLTVARRVVSLAPQARAYVFDRGVANLISVAANGTTEVVYYRVTAPGTDWPSAGLQIWQTSATTLEFVSPASESSLAFRVGSLDLSVPNFGGWVEVGRPATPVMFDGALTFATNLSLDVAGINYSLPSSAVALPANLSSRGFPFIDDSPGLAWWDPIAGRDLWRMPLSAASSRIEFAGNHVAWAEPGFVATARVFASGITEIRRAPLEAAVANFGFSPFDRSELWLAQADGRFSRLVSGETEGQLCFLDTQEAPAATIVETQTINDVLPPSDFELKVERSDLQDCLGWTLSDTWTATYEGVPDEWMNIHAGGVTRASDIPSGHLLRVGDQFLNASGRFALESTEPIQWSGSPGDAPGYLQPIGAWVFRASRPGIVALAASGEIVEYGGLRMYVRAGNDAPSRGDGFPFSVTNGADLFPLKDGEINGYLVGDWEVVLGDTWAGLVSVGILPGEQTLRYLVIHDLGRSGNSNFSR